MNCTYTWFIIECNGVIWSMYPTPPNGKRLSCCVLNFPLKIFRQTYWYSRMRRIMALSNMLIPVRLFGKTRDAPLPQLYVPVPKYLNSYLGSQYSSRIVGKASWCYPVSLTQNQCPRKFVKLRLIGTCRRH